MDFFHSRSARHSAGEIPTAADPARVVGTALAGGAEGHSLPCKALFSDLILCRKFSYKGAVTPEKTAKEALELSGIVCCN
ncbi:hypothetical protein [Niveibacterium umoris]|uniref:Uncharacterized protein n=1 Tax=Niveibacterium umoris TaxID=1193620 RepID=A0A840BIG5_9RHOO|nr:hypothetical protein [Niveibacterium umoris]MBB4012124.1 hypothetical protein [Niveibacterium umoris]